MPGHEELIRLLQAVTVLDGIGVSATDDGLVPTGADPARPVSWQQVTAALAHDDPLDPAPRRRLALLIALHRLVGDLGSRAAHRLGQHARLLALPVGHPLNPGDGWGAQPICGGVLELGVGVVDLLPGQLWPLPLPRSVAASAGLHGEAGGAAAVGDRVLPGLWTRLLEDAERLGVLAGRHLATIGDSAVLTSLGGCDALTLATTTSLRRHLLGVTGRPGRARTGMLIAAARRDRIWTGGRATDRDQARAVWLLTARPERGVLEPLRLTDAGVEPVRVPAQRG